MNEVWALGSYGMGGKAIDEAASSGGGEDYFVSRQKAIGIKTLNSPYNWDQIATIAADALQIVPMTARLALYGDSLGDNELGDLLAMLEAKRIIDLICGFQGSTWGRHTSITDNCKRALIIFNPVGIETGFLGDYALPLVVPPIVAAGESLYDGKWRLGNNGKTWVRYVQIEAPHPDDWGVAQDLAFAEIKALQTAA